MNDCQGERLSILCAQGMSKVTPSADRRVNQALVLCVILYYCLFASTITDAEPSTVLLDRVFQGGPYKSYGVSQADGPSSRYNTGTEPKMQCDQSGTSETVRNGLSEVIRGVQDISTKIGQHLLPQVGVLIVISYYLKCHASHSPGSRLRNGRSICVDVVSLVGLFLGHEIDDNAFTD